MTKSKYGARKVVVDGIKFDSGMEAEYYQHLLNLKKQGIVADFTLQPVYILLPAFMFNGSKIQPIKYKGDFLVTWVDGTQEVIDVKGKETVDFKLKKKLFQSVYNQDIRCVTKAPLIDGGGWIDLDILKKNRAARKKAKKVK